MSKNLSELSGRKGLHGNLFEKLGDAATASGTPSEDEMKSLANDFLMGTANTYGATTFYDFLKPDNKNKKVYTCSGSVCMMAGTQDGVKTSLNKHFKEEEVGHMCCLGRCHENGAFHYNGKNYSDKTDEEIASIVKEAVPYQEDTYNVYCHGTPILTQPFQGVDKLYQGFKGLLEKDQNELIEIMKASALRGRGGAGFPKGYKLESCKNTDSDVKFIVCNADEGDPGAYSDRYLLEKQPHLVLYGMMASGYMVGAEWGVVYIRGEYPESVETTEKAIQELRAANLLGNDILGTGFNFDFKVIKAQGAYICGEETALLSSIEGQRPEVRVRPPYPTQEGLFNKPTVVNNVETLASVHHILNHGAAEFTSIGSEKSSGTKLVSLDRCFNKPGMYEVDMGTPLRTVIETLGGGFKVPVKAMHIGGPLGGLVPISAIDRLSIDFETFQKEGFLLGHASIVCIPEAFPLIQYLEHLFEFTADESCGKCFPCRLGSVRGAEMLHKAQHESFKIDRELMDDLLETLEKGSLCALGGGLPLPIQNALMYFEDELKGFFA